ncbi:MAG: VOC family protein [Acidimicrobiales bacterium]|jgi:catechol 2,3-dioxygenase-like lactoylglutathione lyase family enzyme|nr:VOC family protein [Acidimicrobiales bacterium]|tara:strand:- start:680 stop:1171 length:492 start_codon:yes stop_codon:yes gene_type:complete
MAIKAIFHVNVNCSNLEVSLPFYENLGFETVLNLPTGGDASLAEGLGMHDCVGKAAIMMLNPDDPRQTRLDLIEWVSPDDSRPPYEHLARLGINRIALWTVDLDDEYQRLKSDGVNFLSEPLFMGGHTKFVCFRDPDGTIIELIEFHRFPSDGEFTQPVSSGA